MSLIDRLRSALRKNAERLNDRREARDRQRDEIADLDHGAQLAQRKRRELLLVLDLETDEAEREALKARIADYHRKADRRNDEAHHRKERLGELVSKVKWGAKRQTVLRRKLHEAKQEQSPTPAAWQANGHEWHNLTDNAKRLLAVAVVAYDCYCTSITRDWGTGSHHEDVPTRGFDCAGARMTDFQRDLRYGRINGYSLGDLLELFGPDNAACADNGLPYSMAEGSGIEQLHDNHSHAFVY